MGIPLAVLLVEDSADDAQLIEIQLRRAGFEPAARRVDTRDAMARALGERSWDVILADYRLPKFSGPQALELVQASGLDLPFIVVSGTIGEETAVAMMKSGAHDFVLKDRLGRLGAAVSRELREAETRRRQRWAEAALEVLADAGRLVGTTPELCALCERAAKIPVPRLADWCVVYHERDAGRLTDCIAVACRDGVDRAQLDALARRYPPRTDEPDPWFGDALRRHAPQLIGLPGDDALVRLARDPDHLRLLRALDPQALMVVPVVIRGRATGLLVFGARRPRRFDAADLALAADIAQRFALIVDNSRLVRAREEFLATAIHEIKTPIAVIKTAVQLMHELPSERRQQRFDDLLIRLDRQASRLARLVTEVLEIYRIDLKQLTLSRRPTDVAALMERIANEMQVSARHPVRLTRNDPVTAEVDPDRIEQVVTNLIDNAIKYTPGGGEIELESRRDGDAIVVSVRDHGIGIPHDKQGRLFERFYRAHVGTPYAHATSMGVGLYLSNEFVSRHGGEMWFESTEGVGSRFAFRVPIAAPPSEEAR